MSALAWSEFLLLGTILVCCATTVFSIWTAVKVVLWVNRSKRTPPPTD